MKDLKTSTLIILIGCVFSVSVFDSSAQNVGINATGSAPNTSALLDLNSTNKGFLITRVDTANITSPAFGLMTLAPIDSCLYMYSGTAWISMRGAGSDCPCNCSSTTPPTSLTCESNFTDERDGKTYSSVLIGNQCWMSENLNYTPSSGISRCYDNDNTNCNIYGRLYDWNTAMNSSSSSSTNPSNVQGACPTGWHLPSDEEWKELEMGLGMSLTEANSTLWRGTNEGEALKTSTWGGNNSSGFNALPGGFYISPTSFFLDIVGIWWTATEDGNDMAWRRNLKNDESTVLRASIDKSYQFSIRCIKD